MKLLLTLLLPCLFLCQCDSVKVTGAAPNPPISHLAIVNNDDIHMSDFQPELIRQVQAMGIKTEVVTAPPAGNVHYLTFAANWAWDIVMHLQYFRAELHQGPTVIGTVKYEASGLDMNKYGNTAQKTRPMLRQLLLGEKPVKNQ